MNTVSITMSASTVEQLKKSGNALVAFKAVHGRDLAALPLVWLVENHYDTLLSFECDNAYNAYVSQTPIKDGNVVQTASEFPIALGQTFAIDSGRAVTVRAFGSPGLITISNGSSSPFTAGIGQSVNHSIAPSCAYPLHGGNTQTLAPAQQVAMLFTTELWTVGQMLNPPVPQRSSSGAVYEFAETASLLLIDLDQMPNAIVNYDIDAGWSWTGKAWASVVPLSSLVSSMILPDAPAQLSGATSFAATTRFFSDVK